MINYFKSENLKINHTFVQKLIWVAPIAILSLAVVLQRGYFVQTVYNWWYAMFLIAVIALNSCLQIRIDDKKKNKAVLSLPVDLRKVYFAKILVGVKNLTISTAIICITATIGQYIFPGYSKINLSFFHGIEAFFVIVLTSIWMVPLFHFFSTKVGIYINILFGFGMGVISVLIAPKSYWWINPFSYTCRAVCPIIKIMPNGLLAEPGNVTFTPEILNMSSIPISIIISLALFAVLTYITTKWYEGREVI